jgi:hypothetical protein
MPARWRLPAGWDLGGHEEEDVRRCVYFSFLCVVQRMIVWEGGSRPKVIGGPSPIVTSWVISNMQVVDKQSSSQAPHLSQIVNFMSSYILPECRVWTAGTWARRWHGHGPFKYRHGRAMCLVCSFGHVCM